MGRIVRYIIFLIVILVFLAATAVTVSSGGNPGVIFASGILALIGLPQTTEWLWDRLGPARGLRPNTRDRRTEPGTIEDYLNGKLREFADEERRFVPLALAIKPAYQETEGEPTEDIARLFRENGGRLALIGDPGAGKSTTLRHLMRQAIDDYKTNPDESRVPVWINLGEGANPIDGMALLQHWWEKRCFLPGSPERFLRQLRLLLLFDGLNEMPLDTRDERAAALREWLTQNTEVQAVVTCRVRDYEDDEAMKMPLPAVRVLPLDDTRVHDFIRRNGGDDALWSLIQANDALRALAANPYNLYQLVQIYAENQRTGKTEALPSDLNTLYRRYVEVAFNRYTRARTDKRDAETPLLRLPLPKLEARLKRLAFAMLTGGKGTSADLEWALHWRRRWRWGQQAIMDGINLGVLLGDGQSLRFYHQSLHGYFAIEPLSNALTVRGRFDRLTKNPVALIRQIGELGSAGAPAGSVIISCLHSHDLIMRRSAAVALGQIGEIRAIEPLIDILADSDPGLARLAAESLGKLGSTALEPLLDSLSNQLSNVRYNAAYALGKLGDVRAIDPLIETLSDIDASVRSSAAFSLGELGDRRAVESLIQALDDLDWDVRRNAADGLGKIGDTRAVEPLIDALSIDWSAPISDVFFLRKLGDKRGVQPFIVRVAAARALKHIGTPEALAAVQVWHYGAE
ncbi:MAG: HEAT repeat domain-containing protein [Anaerolineae bacterium]|nr:HEAT repeat domain-containing protein [Anaerolineae bacterium]